MVESRESGVSSCPHCPALRGVWSLVCPGCRRSRVAPRCMEPAATTPAAPRCLAGRPALRGASLVLVRSVVGRSLIHGYLISLRYRGTCGWVPQVSFDLHRDTTLPAAQTVYITASIRPRDFRFLEDDHPDKPPQSRQWCPIRNLKTTAESDDHLDTPPTPTAVVRPRCQLRDRKNTEGTPPRTFAAPPLHVKHGPITRAWHTAPTV